MNRINRTEHPMNSRTWTGLVFIGTSVDGMIARSDHDLSWLISRGEAAADAGYTEFSARIDSMLMGRGTYDVVRDFDVWAYEGKTVLVLSTTLQADADPRIRVVRDLAQALAVLDEIGARGVYIDGGRTISACLAAGLVDELTISQVPVLIGEGIRLFGSLPADVPLTHVSTTVLGGGMVQTTYRVEHAAQG